MNYEANLINEIFGADLTHERRSNRQTNKNNRTRFNALKY